MHLKITVRPATEADAAEIHDITREAFAKYAHDLGMPQNVKALKDTEETVLADLKSKHVLVGELNGVVQGTIRYEIVNGIAYFSRFGVRLVAQSCGMGGALVKRVVENAVAAGCKAVALHTSARMASLIRFYYGQGFYINSINTSRGYYRALLIKELNGTLGCEDYAQFLGDR